MSSQTSIWNISIATVQLYTRFYCNLLFFLRPTLVHTQPFLSLVLACLKGQEDQREGLLSSIHRQLTQLLSAPAEVCILSGILFPVKLFLIVLQTFSLDGVPKNLKPEAEVGCKRLLIDIVVQL